MDNLREIITQAANYGISEEVLKAAVINKGNNVRLKEFFKKADAGGSLTVGFFGGSVTAGSNSSEGKCYANNVTEWLNNQFSKAEINKLNAGKGATGSLVGVYRMDEELLSKKPDLIFIDFSVNDALEQERDGVISKEPYEGVVRKAVASGAAVVLFCICNENKKTLKDLHCEIGKHYGLPVISMVDSIYPLIESGRMKWTDYSNDSLHPINYGHKLLSLIIEYYLSCVMGEEVDSRDITMPTALFSDVYQKALMSSYCNIVPFDAGSFSIYHGFSQFDNGWISNGSEPIRFEITNAKEAHLIILYSPDENMGSALVEANGQKTVVDCHFKNGWGEKALAIKIYSADTPRYVSVKITPQNPEKKFVILRVCKAYDYETDKTNVSNEALRNELIAKSFAYFDKTIAVLCDDLPDFNLKETERIIDFLRDSGYYVHKITVDYLCTKKKDKIGAFLLIPNASSVPAVCALHIDNYWKQGGLVFTLGGALFAKYVDKVDGKWKELPLKDNEFDAALSGKTAPIAIEGITPTYKTYKCNNVTEFFGIENIGGSGTAFEAEKPLRVVSPVVRPKGEGYKMERKNRFIPLVGIGGNSDRTPGNSGTAAFMMLSDTKGHLPTTAGNRVGNVSDTTCGSLIASIGITEQNLMDIPGVPETMLFMLSKMQDGLFIFEGGADKYAYDKNDRAVFGAKILNISQDFKKATVRLNAYKDGKAVYEYEKTLLTVPRKFTEFEFYCDAFEADDYTVTCELLYNGAVIDEVKQEICLYMPGYSSNPNDFIRVEKDNFILNNQIWYPFAINYWPLYCPSIERNEYWLGWLDKSNYIPDEVEKDLVCLERLGINCLLMRIESGSFQSYESSFKDFLMKCRKHNLKISLSYPNATCPIYYYSDAFKELMERFGLINDPIVFSHDISWEIGHQPASPLYRNNWDFPWAQWLEERYGSIENAEKDFGVKIDRTPDGRITAPCDEELVDEGPWNVKTAAYRRFIEDYYSKMWNIAVSDMKRTDPNHLISFRRGVLVNRSMAFNITNKHTDYSSLEGYYIELGERDYHISCSHTALMRMLNNNRPIIWSEYGLSLTGRSWEALFWDHEKEEPFDYRVKMATDYINQFIRMFKQMDVKGTSPWWWPGGFRTGEMSDNGFCGPDGVLRPYAKDYISNKEWFLKERPKKEAHTVMVDAESHARGYHYLCTDILWKESQKAEEEGCMLKTVTEATGTTSANVPLKAIGNVPYNGTNPPKYLNGEFNFIRLKVGDKTVEVSRNGSIEVPENEPVYITLGAGNLKEAKWLSPKNVSIGGVYFVSSPKSDLAVKIPIESDAEYLGDTESAEALLTGGISQNTHIALSFEAENRAKFGEIFEFDIIIKGATV